MARMANSTFNQNNQNGDNLQNGGRIAGIRVDELDALIQVTGLAAIESQYQNPFHPKATLEDDNYGGREVYELLTITEALDRRENTNRLETELKGIFKAIYLALTGDQFHMWLGGLLIDESGHYQYILKTIFEYRCFLQAQLFLRCHVPLFKHHLEIEDDDFPGAPYMRYTVRTYRMLDDLRRIQFYSYKEDMKTIMCLLLCLQKPAPHQIFRNLSFFLQGYDDIRFFVCMYLKDEYVKTMY
jgi:hypothetical protein